MQFNVLNTLIVLVATATSSLAQTAPTGCQYEVSNYVSSCVQGNNLFCSSGILDVASLCSRNPTVAALTGSVDAYATTQNEAACSGLSAGNSCMQTFLCCPSS